MYTVPSRGPPVLSTAIHSLSCDPMTPGVALYQSNDLPELADTPTARIELPDSSFANDAM